MKKIVIFALAMALVTTGAFAQDETESTPIAFGARAGYSFNPDQFFIGAHTDLGMVLSSVRVVPNVEFGFGGDWTTIAFNGDFIYDFSDTPWGVGGEVGVIYTSWDDNSGFPSDFETSSTEVGLSALGNYRLAMNNGKTLTIEGKIGLANSPDFKLSVGYNFF